MAACGRCNRQKGADLLPNIGILFRLAEKKTPIVQKYREEHLADRKLQKLKAEVDRALAQSSSFKQDLYTRLTIDVSGIASVSPTPWLNEAAHERAKQLLGSASNNLLAWPQTTDGHWFYRQELDEIKRTLSGGELRFLALLGPPGSDDTAEAGPEAVGSLEQWKEARSRLLTALQIGSEDKSLRENEGREEQPIRGGVVKSSLTAEEMAKLSDTEILALLAEYPDTRGADIKSLQGGSVEVAAAFGQFARAEPERALEIVMQLQPGMQEYAAGQGLDAIAKADTITPARVIQLARELKKKGFSSTEFVSLSGWALVSVANRSQGFEDDTIQFLLDSVQEVPESRVNENESSAEGQLSHSR